MINAAAPNSNNVSFKGYDARRLSGFLMNTNYVGVAEEMEKIGKKEGFSVLLTGFDENLGHIYTDMWAQDNTAILQNSFLVRAISMASYLKKLLHLPHNKEQHKIQIKKKSSKLEQQMIQMEDATELPNGDYALDERKEKIISAKTRAHMLKIYTHQFEKMHIPGGNYFIVKGPKGKDELLIGHDSKKISKQTIKKMFNVSRVITLPQMDFHLDLFIRPLDKQRILIADDKLMLDTIEKGIRKVTEKLEEIQSKTLLFIQRARLKTILDNLNEMREDFILNIKKNKFAKLKEVEQILQKSGYKTIHVPGRLYETYEAQSLFHSLNFMNANAFKNSKGEMVYITNHSLLDDNAGLEPKYAEWVDFSFKNEFAKHLSPFVDPKHIYFVSGNGNMLPQRLLNELKGGIHCLCAEIPHYGQKIKE